MKSLFLILITLVGFGCSQTAVSGKSAKQCVAGRLCSSASDTACYSTEVYELDPMGIVGDNFVCTKN